MNFFIYLNESDPIISICFIYNFQYNISYRIVSIQITAKRETLRKNEYLNLKKMNQR